MSFEIVNLQQGTPEWLEFRKNHIGASDAPIIMNESPWKTKHKLWKEKVGLDSGSFSNKAMERGIELEPKARRRYIEMSGVEVVPTVVRSLENDFMMASYDGLSKDCKTSVEIKCPGKEDHELAKKGLIPTKYRYQLMQQMYLVKSEYIDYFSYRSDDDVALVRMKYDEDMGNQLVEEERKFWDCMRNLEEPELVAKDFIEMKSAEWGLTVDEYLSVKRQLKELEAKEKAYKDQLIAMANGDNCQGAGVKLTQFVRKGTVDYAAIPELKGLDLNPYRKAPIKGWLVSVGK